MNIVAVSQQIDQFSEYQEVRDVLDQRLITFLLAAGFIPVPVPNSLYKTLPNGQYDHEALNVWLEKLKPAALVLSGGNDIGQFNARDLTEGWLLDYARVHRSPVLGICRGMQMLAHWAGTDLHSVQGHVRTRHNLYGKITGDVNSYHAYSLVTCPDSFEVLAQSEDGEIEAIRHRSLPWEGWMWHPEREECVDVRDLQRIRRLFT